jgi:type IV secretory pathway VirJ component
MTTTTRTLFILTFIVLISVCYSGAASVVDTANVAPFGKVYIYKKEAVPLNVVIMISGDGGWKSGVVSFSESFSEMNTMVIGVDILRYYKDLRQRTEECYNIAADFVQLATEIEKKYNFPDYKPPLIMGYSSGATLVYGILAQARPGTFVGGISVGFCTDIDLPKMLCQTHGLKESTDVPGKSYFLKPDVILGNPWIVLQGKLDRVCSYTEVADFVSKTADAELVSLPAVGHGFSKWSDFMPQWKDAFNRLNAKYNLAQAEKKSPDQVKDLPLVITNAKSEIKDTPIALLVSGDGGWYGFEQSIADKLANAGISTIGLDSKKYFWNRKSPDETAGDIARIFKYYSNLWGKDKFMLIGYSLGAEIVPFVINRLPAELGSNIVSAVLLSPETNTDFEIHLTNMLGLGNRNNSYRVIDELLKMKVDPTLIIFGDGEKTNLPELLSGTKIKIEKIPGDHHYKSNTTLIVKTMEDNDVF